MADAFARQLLAEVEAEGLDSLLLALAHQAQAQYPQYTGIPALDAVIQPCLHAATGAGTSQHALASRPPARPPIIEVAGVGPCSGKTQLLYRIAAELLLGQSTRDAVTSRGRPSPSEGDDPRLTDDAANANGNATAIAEAVADLTAGHHSSSPHLPGGIVVWIDCRQTFDIRRLFTILQPAFPSTPTASTVSALTHLHLHRPSSLSALTYLLTTLPTSLLTPSSAGPETASAHRHLSALILHSPDAFLAAERAASASDAAIGPGLNPKPRPNEQLDARFAALAAALRSVQDQLGCPVLVARRAGDALGWSLPPSWARAVDVRVRLERRDEREVVPRGCSALEALELRDSARAAAQGQDLGREEEEGEGEGEGAKEEEGERGREGGRARKRKSADEGYEAARKRPGEREQGAQGAHEWPRQKNKAARFVGTVTGRGRALGRFSMEVDEERVGVVGSDGGLD